MNSSSLPFIVIKRPSGRVRGVYHWEPFCAIPVRMKGWRWGTYIRAGGVYLTLGERVY